MGKGDLRSRRGKIYNGSHGKKRPGRVEEGGAGHAHECGARCAAASRASATRRLLLGACMRMSQHVVATSTACSPTFNWREFRSPDGFAVMLPGRPQTVSREVKLPEGDGADVDDLDRHWRDTVRGRCGAIARRH